MEPSALNAEPVLLETRRHGVATLTLNRPSHFNALSAALIDALQAALDRIAHDRSVKVVILSAKGRGYCAGHDLREIRAMDRVDAVEDLFLKCSRMMMTLARIPQPVIAEVHGIATAAGCQLVAACDLAVASAQARFGTPGVDIGAFCSTPSVALGRAVSRKHAMEMLLTGEMISAERALQIGLINSVVPAPMLNEEVMRLADLLCSKSASALATGKRIFYEQLQMTIEDAYALASRAIAENLVSPDGQEGIDAFLEKRAPDWSS
ncbi:MAG: enoyl-CoA hydratase [Burkholderiaceae bacterium]